jgi:hypothetical protein
MNLNLIHLSCIFVLLIRKFKHLATFSNRRDEFLVILTSNVRIRGIRPLLYHCFTSETISLEKKEKTGVAGNDPEEWRRTYTATLEGQLYLNPTHIFGCLRDAARYTKLGRGSIQTLLTATLQIMNDKILLNRFVTECEEVTRDPSQNVYIDIQSVRNVNVNINMYTFACLRMYIITCPLGRNDPSIGTIRLQ